MGYQQREQVRRERHAAKQAKVRADRTATRLEHADRVIRAYEEAYAVCYPGFNKPGLSFKASTGWYVLVLHGMAEHIREDELKLRTRFLYAIAHEREITDGIDAS